MGIEFNEITDRRVKVLHTDRVGKVFDVGTIKVNSLGALFNSLDIYVMQDILDKMKELEKEFKK